MMVSFFKAEARHPGEMVSKFTSTALRPLKRSRSIRTTIPAPVVAILGIEFGDTIAWSVEPRTGKVTVSRAGHKSGQ